MGYTTNFRGQINISPPLNDHEAQYLIALMDTRRMHRALGPYFTDTGDDTFPNNNGQTRREDITDYNRPYPGDQEGHPAQPGLWCGWVPTKDGAALVWNGVEKFYYSEEWMTYLIDVFLRPGCVVDQTRGHQQEWPPGWIYPPEFAHFTCDHVLSGVIEAQGEEYSDRWDLVVTDNVVTVVKHQTDPNGEREDVWYGDDKDPQAWAVVVSPGEKGKKSMTIGEIRASVTESATKQGHRMSWKRLSGPGLGGPEQWGRCVRSGCTSEIGIAVDGFWTSEEDDPRSTHCTGGQAFGLGA